MGGNVLGHLVVLDRGDGGGELRLDIVEIGLRRSGQHVHVNTGRVHVPQAARDVEAAGRKWSIDRAIRVEGGVLDTFRRDRDLHARLGNQRGGFQRTDVGVGVDRALFGHSFLALSALSAAARGRTQAPVSRAFLGYKSGPANSTERIYMTSPARPKPRVEDDALVRGRGRFMDDQRLPNQAFAAFVRSPHAHARVLAVKTDAARAAKQALAVFTAED